MGFEGALHALGRPVAFFEHDGVVRAIAERLVVGLVGFGVAAEGVERLADGEERVGAGQQGVAARQMLGVALRADVVDAAARLGEAFAGRGIIRPDDEGALVLGLRGCVVRVAVERIAAREVVGVARLLGIALARKPEGYPGQHQRDHGRPDEHGRPIFRGRPRGRRLCGRLLSAGFELLPLRRFVPSLFGGGRRRRWFLRRGRRGGFWFRRWRLRWRGGWLRRLGDLFEGRRRRGRRRGRFRDGRRGRGEVGREIFREREGISLIERVRGRRRQHAG